MDLVSKVVHLQQAQTLQPIHHAIILIQQGMKGTLFKEIRKPLKQRLRQVPFPLIMQAPQIFTL
jgi:uncharacterized protein with gpF-like domain